MTAATSNLSRIFRIVFGDSQHADLRHRRLIALIQGAVTSLGGKLIGVMVGFLSVPLTISYLGPERYGAWITIGSLLAWLQLTDFGLGNGLNSAVATAVGQDRPDLIRTHISNALLLLSAAAIISGLIIIAAWPWLNWSKLFGLHSSDAIGEIGLAMCASLSIFLLQFPLSLPGRIYMAIQKGRVANYWGIVGNLLSLGSLLLVTHTKGGLLSLVLAISGVWLLVNLASAIWLFGVYRPDLAPRVSDIRISAIKALGSMGATFFLIQIMALVTFQTDTLVISHYLGADDVPAYSLTYNLFSYTTLPQSIMFSYLWVAYSEAIARQDISWVRRTFRMSLAGGLLFTGISALAFTLIARPFIVWWSAGHILPPASLVHWTAAWSIINAFTGPIACLLAGSNASAMADSIFCIGDDLEFDTIYYFGAALGGDGGDCSDCTVISCIYLWPDYT